MKVIITATTPSIDSDLDPRFGRSAYFIVVDSDTLTWRAVPNPSSSSPGGAGIQAAQYVASERADVVISGSYGINAVNALKQAGVALYQFGVCRTVREALEKWKVGKLQSV